MIHALCKVAVPRRKFIRMEKLQSLLVRPHFILESTDQAFLPLHLLNKFSRSNRYRNRQRIRKRIGNI